MVERKRFRRKKKELDGNSQEMYQKEGSTRGHRVKGDRLVYYFFHSLLSSALFLILAIQLDLFKLRDDSITYLFSLDYWNLVGIAFMISIFISIISRMVAYFFLQGIFWQSVTKNIWQLNKGINSMSLRWFIAQLITVMIWTGGVIAIIETEVLGETGNIVAMIVIYLVLKIIIFIMTKAMVDYKIFGK